MPLPSLRPLLFDRLRHGHQQHLRFADGFPPLPPVRVVGGRAAEVEKEEDAAAPLRLSSLPLSLSSFFERYLAEPAAAALCRAVGGDSGSSELSSVGVKGDMEERDENDASPLRCLRRPRCFLRGVALSMSVKYSAVAEVYVHVGLRRPSVHDVEAEALAAAPPKPSIAAVPSSSSSSASPSLPIPVS